MQHTILFSECTMASEIKEPSVAGGRFFYDKDGKRRE